MRRINKRQSLLSLPESFLDLLLILILVFSSLSLLSLILINPTTKKNEVKSKAEYILTLDWPEGNNDVDIWVKTPKGGLLSYIQKNIHLLHLDRDDQGEKDDIITVNGRKIVNKINQEIVTFRGFMPGEYLVNVYLFRSEEVGEQILPIKKPLKIRVKLEKVNPILKIYFVGDVVFNYCREEIHVLRFNIQTNGNIENVRTDMPVKFITNNLKESGYIQ